MTDAFRAAAVQFATGLDVDENLATCLRMVDAAAAEQADLVVLPEFCNHISVYESAEHCRAVALDLAGPFVAALGERAARHQLVLAATVTARRPDRVTVTSLLWGPDGALLAQGDKQTLMGNEREFLQPGEEVAPVADTALGTIGLYACMDGVTPETPRALRVKGARVLTNSLNSFALDEASLHIPVRAAENAAYVVAANKVGPLLPPDRVAAFSEAMGLPESAFDGAGESQIVDPDGRVLAKAPRTGEAVAVADIAVGPDDRPGPHPVRDRRPAIFSALAATDTSASASGDEPRPIDVAAVASDDPDVIAKAMQGTDLVVLPELVDAPESIPTGVAVVCSRRDGSRHIGEVHTAAGVIATQDQLLPTDRLGWATELGDSVTTVDLPWGRLALVVGDDVLLPEPTRTAAVLGAQVIAVVTDISHRWQADLVFPERSAESRVCLVAASRPTEAGTAALIDLPPDFTLWHPDRTRPFDGTINTPDVLRADSRDEALTGELHPARAGNRLVSKDTDLVGGRARRSAAIVVERPITGRLAHSGR